MKLAVRKAGATSTMANGHVRKGAVQNAIARAWVRTGTGLEQFYASLASDGGSGVSAGITVSPDAVSGAIVTGTSAWATSGTTTVTATGGVAPYTYSWAWVSGDPVAPTAATSATTAFKAFLDPSARADAIAHCVVTDAVGNVANSPPVPVTLNNYGSPL